MYEVFDNIVNTYLANMRANELSEESIASYGRTFKMLRGSMEQHGTEDISAQAVVQFKLEKAQNCTLTSLNLYLSHIKYLSDFAVKNSFVTSPFFDDSLMPPKKKVAKERSKEYEHSLTEEDVRYLINASAPKFTRRPATFVREQAIVTVLLTSGLRNIELRNLTPNDLDWENGLIHARVTKGDKPRLVTFTQTAQDRVKRYLNSGIRPYIIPDDEPLFGHMNRENIWTGFERRELSQRVASYCKSILGTEHRTHAQRHAYASLLIDKDVPIQYISESMGHSSVQTTKLYAKRIHENKPLDYIGSVLDEVV